MMLQKYKLSEVTDKIGDGLHGTPKYDENGEYYFINGNNLDDGFIVYKGDTKKVGNDEYIKNKKELNDKTILLSINGTLGNIAKYNGEKIILGKSACYINVNKNFNTDYIYYVFQTTEFKKYLNSTATGSTIKNVPLAAIRNYEISIPNRENQDKIAQVLKEIENKIIINKRMNDVLYKISKNLYKNFFENPSNKYFDKTLGEVTINNRNKIDQSKNYKVLSAVNTGELILSDDYFNKQVYSKDISKYLNVDKNMFAYNPARINIGSIGINNFDFACCVSPVYVSFSVDNDYIDYFTFYFKSNTFRSQVKMRALGSVRQTLNYNDFSLISISYPDRSLVKQFNSYYASIKKRINDNNKKINSLKCLKETLLPKLMNGEIDLNNMK